MTNGWPMTKQRIIAEIAAHIGISKKQAAAAIDALVHMAYKEAKNGFIIPGLGKLVMVRRKARIGRNPATGAPIKIPSRMVVKFRIAKVAKDRMLK